MNEELDILIARYLDGSASQDELARLEQRLAADPASARALVEAAYYDELLADALTESLAAADDEAPATLKSYAPARAAGLPIGTADARPTGLPPVLGADDGAEDRAAVAGRITLAGATPPAASARGKVHWPTWVRRTAIAAVFAVAVVGAWPVVQWMTGRNVVAVSNPQQTVAVAPIQVIGGAIDASGQISTRAGESATVAYKGEATELTLRADTTLARAGGGSGKRWTLQSGTVQCSVQHQSGGENLVIETPQARVEVVGTEFTVTTRGGWTRIQTSEGTVRVTRLHDEKPVMVRANTYVDVSDGSGAARPQFAAVPPGYEPVTDFTGASGGIND